MRYLAAMPGGFMGKTWVVEVMRTRSQGVAGVPWVGSRPKEMRRWEGG